MKNVILITNSFPFGIVEAGFLAPEYEVLKEKADVYTVTRNTKDKMTTSVARTEYSDMRRTTERALLFIFKSVGFSHVLQRARIFKTRKKLTFSNAKRALTTLMRAFHFETFLKKSEAGRTESACFIHIGMTIRHWRQLLPQKRRQGGFENTQSRFISQ